MHLLWTVIAGASLCVMGYASEQLYQLQVSTARQATARLPQETLPVYGHLVSAPSPQPEGGGEPAPGSSASLGGLACPTAAHTLVPQECVTEIYTASHDALHLET